MIISFTIVIVVIIIIGISIFSIIVIIVIIAVIVVVIIGFIKYFITIIRWVTIVSVSITVSDGGTVRDICWVVNRNHVN